MIRTAIQKVCLALAVVKTALPPSRIVALLPITHPADTWYATLGSGPSATYNCYCEHPAGSPECAPGAENFGECVYNGCHLNYFLQPPGQGSPTGAVENETRVLDLSIASGSDAQLIVDRFESFLGTIQESADPTPFVAVLTFHSPHLPHNAAPAFVKMYNDTEDPLHTDYYGTITDMDGQIGRVRQLLAANGLADNTAVVFTSDNGQEQHQPGNEATEGRISACKRWLKLGGVNVPGLIEWPGVIKGNSRTDAPVVTMDLLPTFLDSVAGSAREDPSWPLDGASLMPLLTGTGPVVRPNDGIGHATILVKLPGDEEKDCLPVGTNHAADGTMPDPDVGALQLAMVQLGEGNYSYPAQAQIAWTGTDGLRLWGTGKFPVDSVEALQACAKALASTADPKATTPEELTRSIIHATAPVFKLYNITEDSMETNDLSAKHPTAKAAMAAKLLGWLASTLTSTRNETMCHAPTQNTA